jgi:hypothetical protein
MVYLQYLFKPRKKRNPAGAHQEKEEKLKEKDTERIESKRVMGKHGSSR